MFSMLFKWVGAVLIALNQLGNAMLGGQPDMAISARIGLARDNGSKAAVVWCHVLDWIDPRDGDGPRGDHCAMSVDVWRERTRQRMLRTYEPGETEYVWPLLFPEDPHEHP